MVKFHFIQSLLMYIFSLLNSLLSQIHNQIIAFQLTIIRNLTNSYKHLSKYVLSNNKSLRFRFPFILLSSVSVNVPIELFLLNIFSDGVSQPIYFIPQVQQMSRTSIKERSRTEITQVVYIPPLKLPEYFESCPKLNKSKETQPFLHPVALDKNSDFLKEKSLYRYAISRKVSRLQESKSSLNLLTGIQGLSKSRQKERECSMKRQDSKQKSFLAKIQQSQQERQRHFKRRNRNQLQKSSTQIGSMGSNASVYQNEKVINYQKSNNKNINDSNKTNGLQFEILQAPKRNNQSLAKQNKKMMELLKQKNKKLEIYQQEIKSYKIQNQKLQNEVHRRINFHSDSFINDQKIQNQIRLRDSVIEQLESSIKYIELENLTLKKAKSQCNRQANLVIKLQSENKILQQKIKKMYKQKTKRRNMKSSLISECSDLSLNLSFDQQDSQKRIEVLKTSERTPQKVQNNQNYSGDFINKSNLKMLSRGLKIKSLK